jgi:Tfp pilus assembly protein PilO
MTSFNLFAKLIIFTIMAIVAAGAIAFTFKSKIEMSAKNIHEKRSLIAVLEKRDENFLALKFDADILRKNLPILRKALPEEDNIDIIVSSLESLAAQTNNTVNLEFAPLDNSQIIGTAKGVSFSASLLGNIGTFTQYLKGLKKLPYFIEISNIAVSGDSGINSNNNSRLVLSAKVYIKK